ncbi:MAG: DHH family phosphoesterase [Candidatus Gottesmanbacteria bacterium]|nr:DHH family phosphoesterase [Candidatus Gottesmanbacteria bacterium]
MDLTADITKVKELLDKANDILVVTHEHPTFDSIGSTLALYLGLVSLGKKVSIVCPDAMTVELSSFIGVNKFVQDLSRKNFVISLDYEDGSIEKVSYNIEGNKFNLVIEPRTGHAGFSQDKVHYSYGGTAADLIFTVDTIHLGGLKKVYESNKELFAGKPIVNIDRHPNNAMYGQMNIVDPQSSSTAEVVSQFLSGVGVRLAPDIATNILNALYGATNAFQTAHVNAQAFELAAACLKAGGKRFWKSGSVQEEVPTVAVESVAPPPAPVVESKKPVVETPPDWLKPKIYKSSNLL